MKTIRMTAALFVLASATGASAQTGGHAGHEKQNAAAAATTPADPRLPPSDVDAKVTLEKSPRHGEYVDVKVTGSKTPIRTWIVYPERKDKAPVVIVIHEVYGLSDWIRGVADQLAEDGFIAVAPDLISGKGPNGGGTEAVESRDEVVKLVRGLTPDEVLAGLNAVRDYALKLPAATSKAASIGFCWGGRTSFEYAVAQPALDAAVVYYGTSPAEPASLAMIKSPVLGLYGEDDARVNATVPPAEEEMKKLGKAFETHTYAGAGHGFLRDQGGREGANLKATQQAWPQTLAFLRKHLGK